MVTSANTNQFWVLYISLEDQFHVKGVDTTMGYIGWINTYEGDTQIQIRAKFIKLKVKL
jgi:hypothetical protein